MIEIQHGRDRKRFMRRNMALAKRAELDAERQRLERQEIPAIRRPLIDKLFKNKPLV